MHLEETINISCDSVFGNEAKTNNFRRNNFEKPLRMPLQNNFFHFDGKIYKQTLGSPLGSSLANAFLSFHEQIRLNDCPEDFKSVYCRRYVDDIFALFRSPDHLEKFTYCLNSKHKNIKFTYKKESNNSLPFLNILISRPTNQLLVRYILTSIVSFMTNIKLVCFVFCYLEHFHLSLTFPGLTRKSVI